MPECEAGVYAELRDRHRALKVLCEFRGQFAILAPVRDVHHPPSPKDRDIEMLRVRVFFPAHHLMRNEHNCIFAVLESSVLPGSQLPSNISAERTFRTRVWYHTMPGIGIA